jgi:hypothetical protein
MDMEDEGKNDGDGKSKSKSSGKGKSNDSLGICCWGREGKSGSLVLLSMTSCFAWGIWSDLGHSILGG